MSVLMQLAAVFFKIGLFTVGGGLAMLPLIRDEMLAHGWMSEADFLDILAVAEMTPGPMSVNTATFVGYRLGGVPGALTATLSLALPSLLVVCLLGIWWQKYRKNPASVRVLSLLRPVITGLVLAAALGLFAASVLPSAPHGWLWGRAIDWRGLAVFAGVVTATWRFRVHPVAALACGGLVGFLLYGL